MKKFFKHINGGYPGVFILQDGSYFDLRLGFPKNCLDVWKSGKFKYLGLTPEAVELFEKEKLADLIKFIQKSKCIEDIQVLASVKPDNKKLQEVAEEKIKSLTN